MKKIDKDKPWTWLKYREDLCAGCRADCCRMPVEVKFEDLVQMGLANIDEKVSLRKLAKRLIKERQIKSYREASGFFMLAQQQDGTCIHLDQNHRCKIYDRRPSVCRDFPQIGLRPGYCPASRANVSN